MTHGSEADATKPSFEALFRQHAELLDSLGSHSEVFYFPAMATVQENELNSPAWIILINFVQSSSQSPCNSCIYVQQPQGCKFIYIYIIIYTYIHSI